MSNKTDKLSVFISLILRHKPEVINIRLDEFGYANVEELIKGVNDSGRKLSFEILEEIVVTDNKKRYSFNEDKTKIRANQGHSVMVNLDLKPVKPPMVLYHGTSKKNLEVILAEGLKTMTRNHVHLSIDKETALKVGKRHGEPILLEIDSNKMYLDGHDFYLSENGVWLTNSVPIKYIK